MRWWLENYSGTDGWNKRQQIVKIVVANSLKLKFKKNCSSYPNTPLEFLNNVLNAVITWKLLMERQFFFFFLDTQYHVL